MSVSLTEQEYILSLEEPVKCSCGRSYTITCNQKALVEWLECICGIRIKISGKLIVLGQKQNQPE